jgi:putative hydrolase of the HAD superfamily
MHADIQLVLLDLGGVLLGLNDPVDTFSLDLEHEEFLETWLLSPAVRRLETGTIDTEQFAIEIVAEFALPYAPKEFIRRFHCWPNALFDGVPELLDTISKSHQLALLSNTNAIHWDREDIAEHIEPRLHGTFLSFQTGHMKPDLVAYEDVLHHFGVGAANVLFLDDNRLNIVAAQRCGMHAMLTRGFDSLAENLSQAGIRC